MLPLMLTRLVQCITPGHWWTPRPGRSVCMPAPSNLTCICTDRIGRATKKKLGNSNQQNEIKEIDVRREERRGWWIFERVHGRRVDRKWVRGNAQKQKDHVYPPLLIRFANMSRSKLASPIMIAFAGLWTLNEWHIKYTIILFCRVSTVPLMHLWARR